MTNAPLRVLSMVEGTWVTGPIKPLLMFARLAREGDADRRAVEQTLMTTVRAPENVPLPGNALLEAAAAQQLPVRVLRERFAWDLRLFGQLVEAIEQVRPDIVETHQVKCHFILAQALQWRRLRRDFAWIAYHHGYTRASLKLFLYEEIDRWSLRKPDHVVTVCKPFAEQLAQRGAPAGRITVVPNAVEPRPDPPSQQVARLRAQFGAADGQCVVLSVGRLSPEKGHSNLIAACCALPASTTRPLLVFVGDGPERARLEEAARASGVDARFVGHQADVSPYYFAADVFALPSHTEGSPLVLFEAMAARLPVVSTRVGGVPETVQDGKSALLVPPGDIPALAAALGRVCADPALRSSLAAAAHAALADFSPGAYRDRLLTLYDRVLQARAGKAQARVGTAIR